MQSRERKMCVYFTPEMMEEVRAEAHRLDRSLSGMMQLVWKLSRDRMAGLPSANPEAPVPPPRLVVSASPQSTNPHGAALDSAKPAENDATSSVAAWVRVASGER